jgi:hypothetical protein
MPPVYTIGCMTAIGFAEVRVALLLGALLVRAELGAQAGSCAGERLAVCLLTSRGYARMED